MTLVGYLREDNKVLRAEFAVRVAGKLCTLLRGEFVQEPASAVFLEIELDITKDFARQ